MSLPVDRTQSQAVNLQVLRRQDEAVVEIEDTASHVVMYEFDQDGQSWKRKEVEGCLFVVKRSTAPRFQICVSNRLSTTNMTLAVDERLEVDAVDSFMILRAPDAAYATGFAIYGAWFFPEEDRERIRALLSRLILSAKDTQQTQPPLPPSGAQAAKQIKQHPKPQLQPAQVAQLTQQQQQQQQQTATPKAEKARSRSRSRNKREKQPTPTKILQRDASNGSSAVGMVPISHADGVEAGQAILGMISHKQEPARAQTQPLLAPAALQPKPAAQQQQQQPVSKEQLKQTLISLLDDSQFFDQIYHAYVDRVLKRA